MSLPLLFHIKLSIATENSEHSQVYQLTICDF